MSDDQVHDAAYQIKHGFVVVARFNTRSTLFKSRRIRSSGTASSSESGRRARNAGNAISEIKAGLKCDISASAAIAFFLSSSRPYDSSFRTISLKYWTKRPISSSESIDLIFEIKSRPFAAVRRNDTSSLTGSFRSSPSMTHRPQEKLQTAGCAGPTALITISNADVPDILW
ncbi:hypothetical protein KCU88_g243, partial [Aureobasidium melanogenum]